MGSYTAALCQKIIVCTGQSGYCQSTRARDDRYSSSAYLLNLSFKSYRTFLPKLPVYGELLVKIYSIYENLLRYHLNRLGVGAE